MSATRAILMADLLDLQICMQGIIFFCRFFVNALMFSCIATKIKRMNAPSVVSTTVVDRPRRETSRSPQGILRSDTATKIHSIDIYTREFANFKYIFFHFDLLKTYISLSIPFRQVSPCCLKCHT